MSAILAVTDWGTLVPVGTVTGMLVAVMTLFVRDNARQDSRADQNTTRMLAAAEAERDRAREEIRQVREDYENRLRAQIDEMNLTKKFLYDRIATLERILFNEERTVRPHDVPPEQTDDNGDAVHGI